MPKVISTIKVTIEVEKLILMKTGKVKKFIYKTSEHDTKSNITITLLITLLATKMITINFQSIRKKDHDPSILL